MDNHCFRFILSLKDCDQFWIGCHALNPPCRYFLPWMTDHYNCSVMSSSVCWLLVSFLLMGRTPAAAVEHSVVLGSWRVVKSVADSGEVHEVRIRRLLV